MPIYEYHCSKCGNDFEKIVKNSCEKVSCEKCSSKNVERKLSVFSAKVVQNSACPAKDVCPSASKRHTCGMGCGCHH